MENKNKEIVFKKFKNLDKNILKHLIVANIINENEKSKRKNLNILETKHIQKYYDNLYSHQIKFSNNNQDIFSQKFYNFVNTLNF